MEKWTDIKEAPGYQISDCGNVRNARGAFLAGEIRKGYRSVLLQIEGKQRMIAVHRLVAEAFVPNPENKPQVNHINGVKTDNRAVNLEWATAAENNYHARSVLGSGKFFTADEVAAIRNDSRKQREIAKDYGVTQKTISKIKTGKNYSWVI